MALPVDVTDPGTAQIPSTNGETFMPGLGIAVDVNAGELIANQPTATANNQRGDSFKPGLGILVDVASDQVAEQAVAATPLLTVRAGDNGVRTNFTIESTDPGTQQVPMNNVESQVFGSAIGKGLTPNVFV